jgi:hypothetical protein
MRFWQNIKDFFSGKPANEQTPIWPTTNADNTPAPDLPPPPLAAQEETITSLTEDAVVVEEPVAMDEPALPPAPVVVTKVKRPRKKAAPKPKAEKKLFRNDNVAKVDFKTTRDDVKPVDPE